MHFVLRQVDIQGATALPAETFRDLYAERLGRQISLAELYDLASQIQSVYRGQGYFLTRVIVPPQEIRDGRVRLRVVEGFINDVRVEGDVGPVASKIEAYLQDVIGERPLRLVTLERALLLANDLPGMQVVGVLRPAREVPGAAQLVVNAERDRFGGLAVIDNFGSSFTGEWEAFASASANAFTSLAEQVTVGGLVSEPPYDFSQNQKVVRLGGSFRPGSNGWYVQALASYGDSDPVGPIRVFDFDSDTLLVRIAGGYPIIRLRNTNLTAEAGFDFINSDTDVFQNEAFSRDRLRVLYAALTADHRDAWRGASTGTIQVRQGLPILNASRADDDLLSRDDATGVFTTVRASLSRLQGLFDDFALFGLVAGQFAFDPLLADEEFDLGGSRFGRGFDPGEISADHGVGLSGEVQFTREPGLEYMERYQVFVFYDVGKVWERDQEGSASLASAGGGVRLWPTPWLSVELMAAKPLTRGTDRADGGRDPQVLFRALGSF